MADENKKKGILSKEITFGKSNTVRDLPAKKGINFIHDTVRENNKRAMVAFVIFMAFLVVFTYFGVIRLIQRENEAESEYNSIQTQIDSLNNSMKDYDEVQTEYNGTVGTFMNDSELASSDRLGILDMIDEDISADIPLSEIHITGSDVEVISSNTSLDQVSSVLSVLQKDSRNGYATVTTTSAGSASDSDQVIADFKIHYGAEEDSNSDSSSSSSSASGSSSDSAASESN